MIKHYSFFDQIFNLKIFFLKFEAIVVIYKGLLETSLFIQPSKYERDPADILIHFTEEEAKNQAESFIFLQLYLLMFLFAFYILSPIY